jgi:hypothetical protein
MPNDDAVDGNLQGMDDLDFVGWNNADWTASSLTITPTMSWWTGKVSPRPTVSRSTSRP